MSLAVALAALSGGCGLWLLTGGLGRLRAPRLNARLGPYLGGKDASASGGSNVVAAARSVVGASTVESWRRLAMKVTDRATTTARLAQAGRSGPAQGYLAERAAWGLFGALAVGGLALAAVGAGLAPGGPAALFVAVALSPCGFVAWDGRLRRDARRRSDALLAGFPAVADLICLAVTAGESLRAALERVAGVASGPLGEELRAVLADAHTGVPLDAALAGFARRVRLGVAHRFADAVAMAQERGVPLADSLAALAEDVRADMGRRLVETAGKRQVYMLLPVIGLVLPAALLFAFYPALVSLDHLVG